MANGMKQRDMCLQDTESYFSGLASACADQGNEYGYSYYWWYYGIPTNNCHALVKRR